MDEHAELVRAYRELNFILQATKETLVTKTDETDTPRCVCLFF